MTKIVKILKVTHYTTNLLSAIDATRRGIPIPANLQGEYEANVRSAYKVAKYFKQMKPGSIVILENRENVPQSPNDSAYLKSNFPNGLPKLADLNETQKNMLAFFGGVRFAVYMEIIPEIYHSDNIFWKSNRTALANKFGYKGEYSESNFYNSDDSVKINVRRAREYLALENAVCICENNPDTEVVVVYGALHYWQDLSKCFPGIDLKMLDYSGLNKDSVYDSSMLEIINSNKEYREKFPADCATIKKALNKKPKATRACTPHRNEADIIEEMQFDNTPQKYQGITVGFTGDLHDPAPTQIKSSSEEQSIDDAQFNNQSSIVGKPVSTEFDKNAGLTLFSFATAAYNLWRGNSNFRFFSTDNMKNLNMADNSFDDTYDVAFSQSKPIKESSIAQIAEEIYGVQVLPKKTP